MLLSQIDHKIAALYGFLKSTGPAGENKTCWNISPLHRLTNLARQYNLGNIIIIIKYKIWKIFQNIFFILLQLRKDETQRCEQILSTILWLEQKKNSFCFSIGQWQYLTVPASNWQWELSKDDSPLRINKNYSHF